MQYESKAFPDIAQQQTEMATEVFFHELSKDLLEPQIQISEQNVLCAAKQ